MRTTLVINDNLMKRLRKEAGKRNTTISELVENALCLLLEPRNIDKHEIPPLPFFDLGGSYADIPDREALYHAMKRRKYRCLGRGALQRAPTKTIF